MNEESRTLLLIAFEVIALIAVLYVAAVSYRQYRLPAGKAGHAEFVRLARHSLIGGIVGAAAMFIGTGVGITLL